MYKYTVIIPHKDTPQLLQRCLDSIPQRNDVQAIIVSVLDYFYAKDCAVVHVQSSYEINGLPLKLGNEGAFSLVSEEER